MPTLAPAGRYSASHSCTCGGQLVGWGRGWVGAGGWQRCCVGAREFACRGQMRRGSRSVRSQPATQLGANGSGAAAEAAASWRSSPLGRWACRGA